MNITNFDTITLEMKVWCRICNRPQILRWSSDVLFCCGMYQSPLVSTDNPVHSWPPGEGVRSHTITQLIEAGVLAGMAGDYE